MSQVKWAKTDMFIYLTEDEGGGQSERICYDQFKWKSHLKQKMVFKYICKQNRNIEALSFLVEGVI